MLVLSLVGSSRFRTSVRKDLVNGQLNAVVPKQDLLNENIPKKTFALNLKEELFKSICNIEESNECT